METRTGLTLKANFRASDDEQTNKKYLEGYFVRFNEETELWDGFFETVSSDAIADDIADQDIRALYDHQTSMVLGRTKSGTLTLTKDEKGLYGKILVNEDDPEALSIYSKVQRGDVSQASFGFYITDQEVEERDDGIHSTLLGLDLFEVSIVAFPAYPTTEIGARSKDIEKMKQEKLTLRKQNLLKELKSKWKIQ